MSGISRPVSRQHVSQNPNPVDPRGVDLDVSRLSNSSRSSGTVYLGGSQYPIGSTVGSSGMFVIGDPSGKVNKSTDSIQTNQSTVSQYSSVVGGELKPSRGYDFEDWNWPVIRCSCVVLLVAIMISLLTATIATMIADKRACESSYEWWQGSVLYHISVSEFYDSNDNNVGDIPGVQERINYLKYLGVGGVILKNFMPSVAPFWDKTTSYTGIDERASAARNPGQQDQQMQEFVSLVNEIHKQGLKVIVQMNAAYTSEQHQWFIESQRQSSTSDDPYTELYIWRNVPPPGEGAWFKQPVRNQYYRVEPTHNDTTRPMLNWENTRTQLLIEDSMRFWLDNGVDGFYMPGLRHYANVMDEPGRINSLVRGWARVVNTYRGQQQQNDGDSQHKVIMIDSDDVIMTQQVFPQYLNSLLEAIDLIYTPIAINPTNITGGLRAQISSGLRWQEDYRTQLEFPPWISFTLVNMSVIQSRHLAMMHFITMYLPGTPILQAGQEVGRDPEDTPPPGVRVEPMSWSGDLRTAKPYHEGSVLDVTELARLVVVIRSRGRYLSLQGGGYTIDDTEYKAFMILEPNEADILLIKRFQYQEESVYLVANFDDVSAERDWSKYTSYGVSIIDSAGQVSGRIQLNQMDIPKENTIIFSDIV